MLYLFDLDGTLITSYMDNPDKDYHTWEPITGRGHKLHQLRLAGHIVGVVTNQAGVAYGFIGEQDWTQKWAEVCHRLRLDWQACYVCFDKSGPRRKPSGAMLREAMSDYAAHAAEGVLYVGDRPEDEGAARDAGVPFQWAEQFFAS